MVGALMKFTLNFLILALLVLIMGCGKGSQVTPSLLPSISFTDMTLIQYDSHLATVNIKGKIEGPSMTALTQVTFYADDRCSGELIGSGVTQDFYFQGIQLKVSSTQTTILYAVTNQSPECHYITTYTPSYEAPK